MREYKDSISEGTEAIVVRDESLKGSSSENNVLTLTEFMELVKIKYFKMDCGHGQKEQLKYFESDEAQNYIEQEYVDSVKEYNAGKLGLKGLLIGRASRTAYNLFLMYE